MEPDLIKYHRKQDDPDKCQSGIPHDICYDPHIIQAYDPQEQCEDRTDDGSGTDL